MPLFTWEHASLFITYAAVVAVVSQLADCSKALKQFALAVGLCGLAVALCALCLPDGEYIRLLVGIRGGMGPFFNRNHAGIFLAMCAVVSLGYGVASFLDYARFAAEHRKNQFFWRQVFFAVMFISLVLGVVFTRSRGGMLAVLTGIFGYTFLCVSLVPYRWKTRLKGLLITFTVFLLCSGWILTHTQQINAFAHRASGTSEETRKMLYRAGWTLLKERPVWGIGVGALPVAITPYMEWQLPSYVERLHCDWLELLLGLGWGGFLPLAGGVLWFGVMALARLKKLRTRKKFLFASVLSALLVMGVGCLVDFDLFIPATGILFFLIIGMACSASYDKEHLQGYSLSPVCLGGILLLALSSYYVPLQKTIAWRLHLFGRGLLPQRQVQIYAQALQHYPAPRYALYLGNAYIKQSLQTKEPSERAALRAQANRVAVSYLTKYPKEKELSRLYLSTWAQK
ncbi:O-antigen ligase family protein [Candidatus Avelusimicrobium faecicola]|uniref:O-antigen ligase family protein n=1 Tax=Candidatus Avelusimicrobium faecicola TaxID=3416205 RepID=UPI003D0DB0FD